MAGRGYSFNRVFIGCSLGMTLVGISFITLGSILPLVSEVMELTESRVGVLASTLPLGILVGSMAFGPIADRYSYKYLLVISCMVTFLAIEGIAFSESYNALIICFFFVGIGAGSVNGATNSLVSEVSQSAQARSGNLSFLSVFFGLGALLMPSLMAFFSSSYSYNTILVYVGLVFLIPLIYFSLLNYPKAKGEGGLNIKKMGALFIDKRLMLLGLILFFQSGIEGVINNWTPLYLEKIRGFDQSGALYTLSIYVIAFTLTRLAITPILKILRPYQILIFSIGLMLAGLYLLSVADQSLLFQVSLVLLGVGSAAGFPLTFAYVGELFQSVSGTAFGVVLLYAILGNMLVNFLLGQISEAYSLGVYIIFLATSIILVLVFLIFGLRAVKERVRL